MDGAITHACKRWGRPGMITGGRGCGQRRRREKGGQCECRKGKGLRTEIPLHVEGVRVESSACEFCAPSHPSKLTC
eukprot:8258601-Alexandrium_andersonii.AAC.1